ncbi:MAG: efflux RND transporter periplasmic adaptor subunit [Chitinophagaceae bacterium]|jgi:HlyD family secretion protein|nr:efflux RND transporter periplasmic adaptor subunit [Chitinophagaceae bacterium]
MSKKLKWTLGILVLVVIALIVLSKAGAFGKDEGVKVTAEDAGNRNITEIVTASGKVYPEVEVKVSSDLSGEIVDLPVAEGDSVKKGQVVARIYADIYTSQRDQAAAIVAQSRAVEANSKLSLDGLKATQNQTEAAYNRNKKLLADKVISTVEFEQSEQAYLSAKANYEAAKSTVLANAANVESNQANLTSAEKNIDRTVLRATMDGVISLLNMKKGERVAGNSFSVGTEIMRIADLGSIEVRVDVGENDIPKVKVGDSANIQIDAYSGRTFKGVVYKIANPQVADATTSSSSTTSVTNYRAHIRILPSSYQDLISKNKTFPFRPNMTASADIQTNTHVGVLSVSLNAVTIRDKDSSSTTKNNSNNNDAKEVQSASSSSNDVSQEVVFVLQKDGTVKKIPVQTGIQDLNYIEIKNGINSGDKVITGPYDVVSKQLKDGTKVKIVDKSQLVQATKN